MPTYEYECTSCGKRLEVKQSMKDDPLKDCPACHAASLRKLISAPAFQLKGTGWYVTDFRNNNKPEKDKAKNEESKTAETTATDDKKADKTEKTDNLSATATAAKKSETAPTASTTTTAASES